jgi:hypothetical protein
MRDPRRVVIAFMTALPSKRLGFSSPVDGALSLPKQIRSVHRQLYGSPSERTGNFGMSLRLVCFTIVEVQSRKTSCDRCRSAKKAREIEDRKGAEASGGQKALFRIN